MACLSLTIMLSIALQVQRLLERRLVRKPDLNLAETPTGLSVEFYIQQVLLDSLLQYSRATLQ